MSIRLRLALWYGILTGVVLVLTAFLSYAFHTRGHYDDLDRLLVTTADHAAEEVVRVSGEPHLTTQMQGLDVVLRLYDKQGHLLQGVQQLDQSLPALFPQQVLENPSSPAFDWVASLIPPLVNQPLLSGEGAFGTFESGGQRWRVYILPVRRGDEIIAYLDAAAPLGRLDASMQAFQRLLVALVTASLVLGFAGSWATASGALNPVARMIGGVQAITQSRDLSQRVEASQQRDELGRLAAAFNHMLESLEEAHQAQQRFIGDASHELRAPLTAIQANLDLLQRHPDMAPADRDIALAEATREAHRVSRLVADLLVLEAVSEARHLAHGQRINIEKLEPGVLFGDNDRLKQLLLILLDNAIKYTPPEGQVSVALRHRAGMMEMLVQDTGIGVPADALPHLFERFYRADPARARDPGGTGLGLSIAQWLVEQHGGRIEIQSPMGAGTTVTLTFPIAA